MSFSRNQSSGQTNIFNTLLYYCYIAFQTLKNKITKFADNIFSFQIQLNNQNYLLDFETTGLNPIMKKLLITFLEEPESTETYIESLINPEVKFDKKITTLWDSPSI